MAFEVEILEEKKNPLIERLELKFKLDYFGEGTPNRLEVKDKIAALKGGKTDLTIIKKIETFFGRSDSVGTAYIYNSQEELEFYEAFHIRVRNLPKEKRKEIYKLKRKGKPFKHLFYESAPAQNQDS